MTIWHIQIFDTIVGLLALGLIASVTAFLAIGLAKYLNISLGNLSSFLDGAVTTWRRRGRSPLEIWGIAFGAFLAFYVGYGTLRNQALLAAQTAINADAGRLLDWERDRPHIRCLYNWYSSYDDGDKCLAQIAADPEKFSEIALYIEEVFFIFKQAKNDERYWKSDYIESIQYWREGVEEDPTGLFTNYLATVNSYVDPPNSAQKVAEDLEAAGLVIPRVCDGYYRARMCFQAIGQNVRESDACKGVAPSQGILEGIPKLEAACRTAAAEYKRKTAEPAHTAASPLGSPHGKLNALAAGAATPDRGP